MENRLCLAAGLRKSAVLHFPGVLLKIGWLAVREVREVHGRVFEIYGDGEP